MIPNLNFLHRVLIFLLVSTLTGWFGIRTAYPTAAQEPEVSDVNLSLQITTEKNALSAADANATPVFNVGDRFNVSIVALRGQEPGIFGGQFEISYETDYLRAVADSLVPGSALNPVVNPVHEIDQANGIVRFAASRQGDLENVAGNVVLATLTFEAVGATEPPEGQSTVIDLQNVKLGAKGGISVPVTGVVDLAVIIRGSDPTIPGPGDIVGNVMVEGRTADNQAGHTIMASGALGSTFSGLTEADGAFWLDDIAADVYTLTASRAGFLAATCGDVNHATVELTTLADVVLLAGDIDGDQAIDITDAVAIGMNLGSAGPENVADLNADTEVDILDLILMSTNFEQTSQGNPWECLAAASSI